MYYYQLWLSSGDILSFYNKKKILIKEYNNILEKIMMEISISNDSEEPYICVNKKFYKAVFDKMKEHGFIPINFRLVNYDTKQFVIY